ncbi:SpoIIE family protein phosphatase [Actinokineospora sp. NBRC 105648]|uniref:SpoIIE family protein phosphatase n=1 Tax=Actinokineospora sp. NBRC 105648 TaxID=3032206 RepID=UPI0024A0C0BE|nr:SpoIIE family protein phosphatase [Actinokineospora sp. NBRC 105648]GLZ38841.1 hypothetical protein Acsp05_24650 [Actinokineospora sp. NBRC 105648]
MAALAFEATPAIVWMFSGPRHHIVAANRMARASVGDRPGLIGTPVREAVPEAAGQDIFELLDEVARTGQPRLGAERRVVVDLTGDGTLVEGFFTYSVVRAPGADGTPVLIAHAVDVTASVQQRRAAEVEVAEVRARLDAEYKVGLELQRSLLPVGLPLLPDLGLSAAYVPAGRWRAAGGDWYDVVPMPGDRVGLVLGDVVGHGPTASGVMGQLRAVAAERLVRGGAVSEVLDALDALAEMAPDARGSSVCVAVYDRLTRVLEHGTRGHPQPLLLAADGTTRFLDGPIGPPLAFSATASAVAFTTLNPEETLVFYSDGVVEAPGLGFTEGQVRLAECVAEVAREHADGDPRELADRVCTVLATTLVDNDTSRDDVTVLAATVLTAPAPLLELALPGTPDQLTVLHRELGGWLDALDAHKDDRTAIALCVVEAVTNSIEHGYRDHSGTVAVHGELDGVGGVVVTVTDSGTWREPAERSPYRGRGMLMMRECSDQLHVDTGDDGTVVRMRRAVRRPPVSAPRAEPIARHSPDARVRTVVESGERNRVTVSGVVDSSNAGELRSALHEAARSGSGGCLVVLDDVELLTSAAMRVLYEQVADLRGVGRELILVAAPDSPAGAALTASGLDQVLPVEATEPIDGSTSIDGSTPISGSSSIEGSMSIGG